jgi:hypothetical protein
MQLTPTQEQLDIIMYEVSQYLNKFQNVYTKTLYKTLRIKEKGLSLNKFRGVLYKMEDSGKLQRNGEALPYWNIN